VSTLARDGAVAASGSSGPRDPLAIAAGAAFLLLVASLAGPIAPMGIATAIAGALTLACFARAPRPAWPRTPVEPAALGWLVAMLVVSACALDRAASFPRVTKAFMPLLVPLAAFHTRDVRQGRRALAVYLAAAGLVAVYGVVVWMLKGASFESRARGLAGHYMTFGGQLLLEIPVALAVALTARGRAWRLGASAVAVLAFAALTATFTRSAWLGLFVASGLILGAVRPLGLIVLAACGLGAWFLAPGAWGERLHSVADPRNLWNRERVFMWEAGVRMFRDHPLTGVGLQDLHPLYDQYRSPESVERAGHLHNAYVQIAASMGLVGLAAFAWLYASLLRTAWAALGSARGLAARVRGGGLAAGVRLGVTAALAGFLVAGMFEWNFGDEELLYHLYTLVGLAWASRLWQEPAS
jgi:O-antigen ligase